jgi:hypothetical protein
MGKMTGGGVVSGGQTFNIQRSTSKEKGKARMEDGKTEGAGVSAGEKGGMRMDWLSLRFDPASDGRSKMDHQKGV